MVEINDFVTVGPVEPEVIESYRDRVPSELIEIWEKYGYGSFGDGFIRIINPAEYEDGLRDCLGKVVGQGISIPIMVTGLADVICWEPGEGVNAILYRNGRTTGIGDTVEDLLKMVNRNGARYLSMRFDWDMFPQAVAAHGPLAHDESFMYVPLLALGGPNTVENMKKRDTIDGIKVMVEFQGVIEH